MGGLERVAPEHACLCDFSLASVSAAAVLDTISMLLEDVDVESYIEASFVVGFAFDGRVASFGADTSAADEYRVSRVGTTVGNVCGRSTMIHLHIAVLTERADVTVSGK